MTAMQKTFGDAVGLPARVNSLPDMVCKVCGKEFPLNALGNCEDIVESEDGDILCHDCARAEDSEYVECEDCGGLYHRDHLTRIDGSDYCDDCRDDGFAECARCGDWTALDDLRTSDNGEGYCEHCYDRLFTSCEGCGDEVRRDGIGTYRSENGDYWCESCYHENFDSCCACGCEVSRDDSYVTDYGDCYCESCYSDRESEDDGEYEAGSPRPGGYAEMRSRRVFSVELETAQCDGYTARRGDHYFGDKSDGSITGREFVGSMLAGDTGLGAIRDFCRIANSEGWTVDPKCGFHAHFDARDLTTEQCKAVAYAYYATRRIWSCFVAQSRVENYYCKQLDAEDRGGRVSWDGDDIRAIADPAAWERFADLADRYRWINVAAYSAHTTFEVRLHGGTLSAEKVCNWVKAHARFIDAVKDMAFAEIDALFNRDMVAGFAALAEMWDDAELTDFYASRAKKFGHCLRLESVPCA